MSSLLSMVVFFQPSFRRQLRYFSRALNSLMRVLDGDLPMLRHMQVSGTTSKVNLV